MHVNVYFLSAIAGVVAVAWEALRTFRRNQTQNIEEMITKAISPMNTRLTVVETKIDLLLSGLAANSAAILHHPEPSRARVDYLLDLLKENTITDVELEELRDHLHFIMHYESGCETPYAIFPGEQAAAGLLLATMDHVVTPEETNGLPDTDTDSTEDA